MVIGHQKGRNTKENVRRNFGMPRPEGYRKARRLMELAARFGLPVLTFIDTPGRLPRHRRGGARPGRGHRREPGGHGRAARAGHRAVIGEGGSGGALALGVANRVLMLEYSIYSVISPEGCSAILCRDPSQGRGRPRRSSSRRATWLGFGIADELMREPPGGAHRDPALAARNLGEALRRHLVELRRLSPQELIDDRYRRFRSMGVFVDER